MFIKLEKLERNEAMDCAERLPEQLDRWGRLLRWANLDVPSLNPSSNNEASCKAACRSSRAGILLFRNPLPPCSPAPRVTLKGCRAVEAPTATLAWQALYAGDQHGKARSMGISGDLSANSF